MTEFSKDTNLIHYHAPTTFKNGEPLDQAFRFEDGLLTVNDILDDAPKPLSYHSTTQSYNSGVTVIPTSTSPLRLVPALTFKGASSIISTPRPTDDQDTTLILKKSTPTFPLTTSTTTYISPKPPPEAQSHPRYKSRPCYPTRSPQTSP